MAGKTELANRVLMKLGQPRVSNIDTDNSPAAIAVNSVWETVRDATLQMYPWNFAIKRARLAPDLVTPVYQWSLQFTPPIDFLQLLEVHDNVDYVVEGGKILTDNSPELLIKYTARIEDITQYPPLFNELFIISVAIEICDRVTQDTGLRNNLMIEQRTITGHAFGADSIENLPEDIPLTSWLEARL